MRTGKNANYDIAEFLRPARAAGVGSDVMVPLLQAAVSGFVFGLLSLLPTIRFYWAWYIPFIIGGVAFAAAWFVLLKSHRQSLWDIERFTNEQDQARPESYQVRVKLAIEEAEGVFRYVELPIDPDQLRAVARATINGRAFSLASWTGRGRPLSRAQFETLRDWLITNDYGRWVDPMNHAAGFDFTSKGKALWRGLIE